MSIGILLLKTLGGSSSSTKFGLETVGYHEECKGDPGSRTYRISLKKVISF